MHNKGTVSFTGFTGEGIQQDVTWDTTDVDFPILSTPRLTRGGNLIQHGERDGKMLGADATDAFIAHGDVYFLKMFIHKSLVQPEKGFAGQGADV